MSEDSRQDTARAQATARASRWSVVADTRETIARWWREPFAPGRTGGQARAVLSDRAEDHARFTEALTRHGRLTGEEAGRLLNGGEVTGGLFPSGARLRPAAGAGVSR